MKQIHYTSVYVTQHLTNVSYTNRPADEKPASKSKSFKMINRFFLNPLEAFVDITMLSFVLPGCVRKKGR